MKIICLRCNEEMIEEDDRFTMAWVEKYVCMRCGWRIEIREKNKK